jgi:divalent metal cation (Fe/Co/Zn/Cd) transporter
MRSNQSFALQRAADSGGIVVALALIKYLSGLLGHSFALVADGLQSAADVLSDRAGSIVVDVAEDVRVENRYRSHG